MIHNNDHWLCLRRVGKQWYNLDSRYDKPKPLSFTQLTEYVNGLQQSTVFVVVGEYNQDAVLKNATPEQLPTSFIGTIKLSEFIKRLLGF